MECLQKMLSCTVLSAAIAALTACDGATITVESDQQQSSLHHQSSSAANVVESSSVSSASSSSSVVEKTCDPTIQASSHHYVTALSRASRLLATFPALNITEAELTEELALAESHRVDRGQTYSEWLQDLAKRIVQTYSGQCDLTQEACATQFLQATVFTIFPEGEVWDVEDWIPRFAVSPEDAIARFLSSSLSRSYPAPGGWREDIALQMSLLFWDRWPTDALMKKARDGQLDTGEARLAQAKLMMDDSRFYDGVVAFYQNWLSIRDPSLGKADSEVPAALLEEEIYRTALAHTHADQPEFEGTFNALLTNTYAITPEAVANFYDEGESTPLVEGLVLHRDEQRIGVFSRAAVLRSTWNSMFSEDSASLTARGVLIRDALFCDVVPPPDLFDYVTLEQEFIDNHTPQQNYTEFLSRSGAICGTTCHATFDPLGVAFEGFGPSGLIETEYQLGNGDSVRRNTYGSVVIDRSYNSIYHSSNSSTGLVFGSEATEVRYTFHSHHDLMLYLAEKDQAKQCFVEHWLDRAYSGRVLRESCEFDQQAQAFSDSGGNLKQLLLDIVASPTFTTSAANE